MISRLETYRRRSESPTVSRAAWSSASDSTSPVRGNCTITSSCHAGSKNGLCLRSFRSSVSASPNWPCSAITSAKLNSMMGFVV